MRILIAEDDLTSRLALTGVLKKNGYQVEAVDNGMEAWGRLQQPDAPRLAILDWVMPHMDGLEVVRRVHAHPSDHPPYLLLLTSKDQKADIIVGLDAGANDYLAKPFDPGELRARVEVGRRMVELQEALHASRELLMHQATHDPLTGLLNRRAVLDRLHRELSRGERLENPLAVGMIDIDHFKRFNDIYGHQTGDDILCGLARFFGEHIRDYDLVGRIGGEEFLLVSPIGTGDDPRALFTRLCNLVAQTRLETRSGPLACTLSIGVACAVPGLSVDAILETADRALYEAKNSGRNRVIVQPPSLGAEEAGYANTYR